MAHFIFYHGPVSYEGARNLEILLTQAVTHENPDITLCICSGGGNVGAGIGIYNFIKMQPVPITTYAFGICGSIAATMFLAGSRRLAAPASQFSLHAASYTEGPRQGEISEETNLISRPFSETLHWPSERVDQYFGAAIEQYLTPESAQEFGMVTEIADVRIHPTDEQVHVRIP